MKEENSGSHCEYYHAPVSHPSNPGQTAPYVANCEDIIQALGLTFDEGCEFKSIWRRGRGRQGFVKAESTALRDAQKAVHYAGRVLALEMRAKDRASDPVGQTRYDWSLVPIRFSFVATDADGGVYMYEGEPRHGAMAWEVDSNAYASRYPLSTPEYVKTPGWRGSLEKRP